MPVDDRGGDAPLRACPSCRRLARTHRTDCPGCGARLLSARPPPGEPPPSRPAGRIGGGPGRLPAWFAPFARAPVTAALLAFCVLLFAAAAAVETLLPAGPRPASLADTLLWGSGRANIALGGAFGPLLAQGQAWRLLTACFLHFGIIHLVFNGMAMRDLGGLVEGLWGRRRLWALFIATGVAGNALSFGWHWTTGGLNYVGAGASGSLCGFLGFLLAAWRRGRGVPDTLGRVLVRWAVMIGVFGLLVDRVDNAAHLGGGLAGFAAGWHAKPLPWVRPGSRADRGWTVAAAVAGAGFAACWLMGGLFAFRWLAGSE